MKQEVLLEGKDVSIGYHNGKRTKIVHEHLNFQLLQGELTCLLGANGAGKSTLLRTLSAIEPVLSGELTWMGRPVLSYSEKERSRTMSLVLTDRTQVGGLTVYELVALGRQPYTGFFGRLRKDDKERVAHALEAVGMMHKSKSYVAELSDGERQKAMIAKALVQESPLIVLDEPTAFLDVLSRIEIMELLHRLAIEEQRAILMSTHDMEQAFVLADTLWLMTKHQGMVCGGTEDLILSGAMDRLFRHDTIRFDVMHGLYSPMVRAEKKLVLETQNEVLRHWLQNALNRNGYFCLDAPVEEEQPLLIAKSRECLVYRCGEEEQTFTSISELLRRIK